VCARARAHAHSPLLLYGADSQICVDFTQICDI